MKGHPLLEGMNAQQAAAISAGAGPTLVLAGPGSGKTSVLTRRIAWLIREESIPPHCIMAVTFTNRAADEMRKRVEGLLGAGVEGMKIGTFHRIAMGLLRREALRLGYRSGWRVLDSNRQYWMLRRILEGHAGKDSPISPSTARKAISLAKNNMLMPETYEAGDERGEIVKRAYKIYQAGLLAENLMDVDDLLLQMALLLREFPAVRHMFQQVFEAVLVDEFQDTNLAQYEILKMLAPPRNDIFVVGDEDQSIYAFRGANYRNLLRLRRDFTGLRQILLEQNYRSAQTILDAARALISHNRHRTPKALFSDNGAGSRIQVYEASSDLDEADFAREQIELLVGRTRLRYGDIAIMYRKHTQAAPFKTVLHRHGLPFRVLSAIDFEQRREIKDIMAMLHLAHNSGFGAHFKRLAEIKAFGISKRGMENFLDWLEGENLALPQALDALQAGRSPLNRRQTRAFAGFAETLRSWRRLAARGNLADLLDQIWQRSNIPEHLERICKEDWELAEREQSLARLRDMVGDAARMPDPFESLAAMVASEKDDGHEGQDKIALSTLHSAKGLEFPVVFIIGLNENVLPHTRESDGANDIDEERRLFYVGMTRAESRLYLSYTSHRGLSGEVLAPSIFLAELPERLLDVY